MGWGVALGRRDDHDEEKRQWSMSAGTWALVAGVVLITAFLQTSAGFGFSQVSVPFLIALFAPRDVVRW